MTRTSAIEFFVAEVRKPLARCQDGQEREPVVRSLRTRARASGWRSGSFVFDVELTNGESEVVTLWPRGRCEDVPMMPKKEGLRMCAANGTPITNLCRKLIKFRGTVAAEGRAKTSGFARQAWVREPLHVEDDRAVRPLMPVEIGWGEVSGPSEETRTPVKMNGPHAPSQKEREQHDMTHLPFRSWCWKWKCLRTR